jgi:hypothetical protein
MVRDGKGNVLGESHDLLLRNFGFILLFLILFLFSTLSPQVIVFYLILILDNIGYTQTVL